MVTKRRFRVLVALAICLVALLLSYSTWRESGGPATVASAPESKRLELELTQDLLGLRGRPQPSISGLVRTKQGAPIAGARVCVVCGGCDLLNSPAPGPTRCVESNASGRYSLSGLASGTYRLSTAAHGFRPSVFNDGRPIELRTEDLNDHDIVLEPGGAALSGVVVDATGGVVVGATVRAYFGKDWLVPRHALAQEVRTDESGEFRLALSEGNVGLAATADGYAGTKLMVFPPARDIRMVLTPDAQISGTVISEPGGEPVADVVVTAQAEFGEGRATSDASGSFTIKGLRPGVYELDGSGPGWFGRRSGTVTLDLGEEISGIDIGVSHGVQVSGAIWVGDAPCEAGTVHLVPAPGEAAPALSASSDGSGAVAFEAVPPGRYRPSVSCLDYGTKVEPWLDVAASDLTGLSWRFDRGVELRVRTQTPEGKPVAGAWVILTAAERAPDPSGAPAFPKQLQSDDEGLARLVGVAPGKYLLGGSLLEPKPLLVQQSSSPIELTLTVLPMGSIDVIVHDAKGRANDRVGVSAEPIEKGGNRISEFGSARGDGRYHVGPLVAGAYRVDVRDSVNPRESAEEGKSVSVRSGEVTVVHLTYGGHAGQISGSVVDATGSPMSNVWVGAIPSSKEPDPFSERLMVGQETRSLTSPEGQFTLEELAPDGVFTVIASHSLGGRGRLENVKVGQQVELSLSAPGSVSGIVRNARGEPPAHFSVVVVSTEHDQSLSPRFGPDAKGAWRIDHVAPGPLEISAFSAEGGARATHTLAAGQQLGGIELLLAPVQMAQNGP